ncbi:hypothetical protein [Streptomyces sp. NPDC058308]|uniref:hypothetical protein n=1 Tax=Streptomyces sp. NPDC058308 TaxID=3346440 RepID=UPI0036E551BE
MRRGVRNVLGAGAAVLCLGGLLSACGGDSGDGYVATGAVPERAPGKTVGPTGEVKLVPLDGPDGPGGADAKANAGARTEGRRGGGAGGSEGKSPAAGGSSSRTGRTPGGGAGPGTGTGTGAGSGIGTGTGTGTGSSPGSHPGGPSSPGTHEPPGNSTPPPSGPAVLRVGDPERAPADKRWCEKVTVAFHNTGGSPVRSGAVTFGTHIIGALGVDWATIESTVKLPVPIASGQRRVKTWPVCVEAWRVPLGMHVETRDVSVKWA